MKLKMFVLVTLMSSAAVTLALQGKASAAEVRLQAILRAVEAAPPPPAFAAPLAAESIDRLFGRVRYIKNSNPKRTEEELKAKVVTSVPNASLGISQDLNDVADQTGFLLRILQGSGPIERGSCVLLFSELEFDYQDGSTVKKVQARFAAKLRERVTLSGMQIRKSVGNCWVNGMDGVPDVVAGDFAEVFLLGNLTLPLSEVPKPWGGVVMTGTFVPAYFHDDD